MLVLEVVVVALALRERASIVPPELIVASDAERLGAPFSSGGVGGTSLLMLGGTIGAVFDLICGCGEGRGGSWCRRSRSAVLDGGVESSNGSAVRGTLSACVRKKGRGCGLTVSAGLAPDA